MLGRLLMQLFLLGGQSPYISAFLTEPVNNDCGLSRTTVAQSATVS